jgi:fructose-1-phosphate kinase PfkB-like protein
MLNFINQPEALQIAQKYAGNWPKELDDDIYRKVINIITKDEIKNFIDLSIQFALQIEKRLEAESQISQES